MRPLSALFLPAVVVLIPLLPVLAGLAARRLGAACAGRLTAAAAGLATLLAAGALLIHEAGGLVGDHDGNEGFLDSGRIAAANGKLFSPFLQLLKKRG